MLAWPMRYVTAPLYLVVSAAAAGIAIPRGATFLQLSQSNGMPPCKSCSSAARLHSRDDLLAMDDGSLTKAKDMLTNQVAELEKALTEHKTKQGDEIGKMKKHLSDMDTMYKKFGKDSVDRASKFVGEKAEHAKKFGESLESMLNAEDGMKKIHESLDELQSYQDPYVHKFISGDCKCSKAKALLQQLQASLRLANIDGMDLNEKHFQALLKTSEKIGNAADPEKYKIVRAVEQLELKRSQLEKQIQAGISDFSEQQRTLLDRIDAAEKKANLKITTETKYRELNADTKKAMEASVGAAADYSDLVTSRLTRLQAHKETIFKTFKSFKAELVKCKCL